MLTAGMMQQTRKVYEYCAVNSVHWGKSCRSPRFHNGLVHGDKW